MILTNNDGLMILKGFQALCDVLEERKGYHTLDLGSVRWHDGQYTIPGENERGAKVKIYVQLWEIEEKMMESFNDNMA